MREFCNTKSKNWPMKDIIHIDDDLWVWIYWSWAQKTILALLFVYLILCLKTYNFAASIQEKK